MPAPLDVPIPLGLVLTDSYIVRFTALDPTTGALVAGVTVSDATIQYDPAPQPVKPPKNTAVFLPGGAFE